MTTADHVRTIQRDYPQIYLACHTRHQRAASSDVGLSANDSSVLAHLDERDAIAAATLARHLGIGPSTLSATLARLATLGYITRTAAAADRRRTELRLSKVGARAMQASSVLDSSRLAAVLKRLTPDEQRRATDGLAILARAARAQTASGEEAGIRGRARTERRRS